VEEVIPVLDYPLEQRQEIPVNGVKILTLLQVGTKVIPSDPDLETTP
jgi:hypothetical protein